MWEIEGKLEPASFLLFITLPFPLLSREEPHTLFSRSLTANTVCKKDDAKSPSEPILGFTASLALGRSWWNGWIPVDTCIATVLNHTCVGSQPIRSSSILPVIRSAQSRFFACMECFLAL